MPAFHESRIAVCFDDERSRNRMLSRIGNHINLNFVEIIEIHFFNFLLFGRCENIGAFNNYIFQTTIE